MPDAWLAHTARECHIYIRGPCMASKVALATELRLGRELVRPPHRHVLKLVLGSAPTLSCLDMQ